MSSNDNRNNDAIVLKAGGERTKVSHEEAKSILERFRSELAAAEKIAGDRCNVAVEIGVRELDLSCRSWEASVLEVFRDFFLLSVAPAVEVLNLDDIIASLPTQDGLATFEFFVEVFAGAASSRHRLRHLNLNDNAIGTRGIEILRPLLSVASLHSIDLTNTGLAEADCKTLLEIATTTTSATTTTNDDDSSSSLLLCERLRRLSLGRNQVGAGGAAHVGKLLARCPRLEHLEYAGARPLVRGTRDLCRGLAEAVTTLTEAGSHLRHLNLKDCHLNGGDDEEDPVLELCAALSKSPNLVHLNVSDCVLTAAGAKRVLKALETSNCPLEFLDMGANELETEGAESLAEYLPKVVASSLRELHLETNELTDEGVCTIVQALCATNNSTTTEESMSSKLVVLHLGENEISKEGASCMLEYTLPPSLKTLHLTDNTDIPRQLAVKLQSKYPAVIIMDDLDDLEEDPDLGGDGDEDVNALAEQLGAERIS